MKKRGIKLLAVFFLSQIAAVSFAYDFSADNDGTHIYYKVKEATDTVYVTSKDAGFNSYLGDVNIPDSIVYEGKRYIVGGIGDSAFRNCDALSSVGIPDGVTYIGDDSFRGCSRLAQVKLPAELKKIGYYAFGMTDLDSISVPSKTEEIGGMAFADCANLKSVKLPDELKVIDNYAFMNCRNLLTVNIPEKIEIIGRSAFFNCEKLGDEIHIGRYIKRIGLYAFGNCYNLKRVYCYGEMYIPYCEAGAFGDVKPIKMTLIVPPGYSDAYTRLQVWKDFETVKEEE